MESDEYLDFSPYFRIYKDGRIERYVKFPYTPPSNDPQSGVRSKDVKISPETGLTVRIYVPSTIAADEKLPVIIYAHGGAFVIESAFSPLYHPYTNSLSAEAKAIVISIEYRLAPENPIPACYDDSWTAFKWVAKHCNSGNGSDPWINSHADFSRVFLAGDSAGANIVHRIMVRYGANDGELVDKITIVGMVLVHPFFGNGKPDKLWTYIAPENGSADDPLLNPMAHPSSLSSLKCSRILVCTAEKDFIRDRSYRYYDALKRSGWGGEVEFKETEGEEHCFFLEKPDCEKAKVLMQWVVSFVNKRNIIIIRSKS
ncbi:OLC1v1003018C1 [Oldenlandia corymbosa var. corymbosa]|uniref:OLC1v1003018C1 n=1 Tax=Oldenlandia corymbosa var. corymbosa TaxID=529605 RepID=A0AAV1D946_OLDCO|nr:OLC1v1003018C1 [Oldenlandia corymbosa var. corymbosa]